MGDKHLITKEWRKRHSVYTLRRRHDGIPIARCYKIPVLLEVENKKKGGAISVMRCKD